MPGPILPDRCRTFRSLLIYMGSVAGRCLHFCLVHGCLFAVLRVASLRAVCAKKGVSKNMTASNAEMCLGLMDLRSVVSSFQRVVLRRSLLPGSKVPCQHKLR